MDDRGLAATSEDHARLVGQVDEHGPRHITHPVRTLADVANQQQIQIHPGDYWPLEPPMAMLPAMTGDEAT